VVYWFKYRLREALQSILAILCPPLHTVDRKIHTRFGISRARLEDIQEAQSQRLHVTIPRVPKVMFMAVYKDDARDEQRWKRTITTQGASEYPINDHVVTATQYRNALK